MVDRRAQGGLDDGDVRQELVDALAQKGPRQEVGERPTNQGGSPRT